MCAETRPTAIVCEYDYMAVGVIQYLNKKGYDVPKDFSVMARCYTNISRYTDYATENLRILDIEGKRVLGKDFYCNIADVGGVGAKQGYCENILNFVEEATASFAYEEKAVQTLEGENLTDFVVCGGACEGHGLRKEVNFSDTLLLDGELVRMPENKEGMKWSTIVAHGWFSYQLKLKPGQQNVVQITAGSSSEDRENFCGYAVSVYGEGILTNHITFLQQY